jgi:hypothetical protein
LGGGGERSGDGGTVADPLSSSPIGNDFEGSLSPGVIGVGGRVLVTLALIFGPSGSLILAAGRLNP